MASGDQIPIKDRLEAIVDELVAKGILWHEAARQFEKLFIQRALDQTGGRIGSAARLMGMHRNTLAAKIRQHVIRKKK
jgi:transcriptional regulator of acetoin/glycerol metabolism